MAVRKTKPAKRVGKKPARAGKPAAKRATVAKKAPAKKAAAKKVVKPSAVKQAVSRPAAKTPAAKTPAPPPAAVAKRKETSKIAPLDVSAFPQESIAIFERWICLACVLDVFTRQLGLAQQTAYLEVKRYTPAVGELYAPGAVRPWFVNEPAQEFCPYCGAPAKWHTSLRVYRIEGGKATDALRRGLLKSLPQTGDQFVILEEKGTQQGAFFEWLEKISTGLDLDNPGWLRDVSLHYLARKEPKTDWQTQFRQVHAIRRSRRLDEGWEIDSGRLFLAPTLFDELLLVQYLVSRSHRAGGLTLEGRYTLPELFARLRNAGYLRAVGVHAQNPGDALEQLVVFLGGGEAAIKFYHVVDRRSYLEKVKSVKLVKPPKAKVR
jgi:hypothetical protein